MGFNSKEATTGGTTIATEVINGTHFQKMISVGMDGNPISNNVEPISNNYYNSSIVIIPTTLTTGLNYFILRNPSPTKKVKIKRIVADAFFVGKAAATRSIYALKKLTGVTSTTGTEINVVKRDSAGSNPIAELKFLTTGLVATGGINANNISHIAHANQLSANMNKDWQFDNPIVLNENEAIVLQSEGAVVAGSTVVLSIQFYEI